MKEIKEISKCRSCYSKELIPILNLGSQYVTDFVEKDNGKGVKCPLELCLCKKCKLLQLKHNAPPESMWNEQYWYKSNISSTIKEDLKEIVEKSQELIKLKEHDLVVDIGCNDGTLLEFYNKEDIIKIGFEPSKNVAKEAKDKGFTIINNFFNADDFKKNFSNKKAKIITAISMFYDLEEPNKFIQDIIQCLDKKGLLVIQQNYLLTMLEQNAFDNICHEHREYYSLMSLKNILDKYDLEIFDIEQNNINGGSIRTYIKFKENKELIGFKDSEQRIKSLEKKEKEAKLDTLEPYQQFAMRIEKIKENLIKFIKIEREKGKKFWIYGASTRGNVVLQYFDLNSNIIDGAADKNVDKDGKKTIGTLIPITSPENMRKVKPDYLIIMIWYFADEIKKQENNYLKNGGKFIVLLPNFEIIEN